METYAVYIISKSGSLLYERTVDDPGSPLAAQTSNDQLVIAGNLHGIYAIASELTPRGAQPQAQQPKAKVSRGLRHVQCERFSVHVTQTATGLKFVLVTSPRATEQAVARLHVTLYELYTDWLMKNPLYNLGMPCRVPRFDAEVARALALARSGL